MNEHNSHIQVSKERLHLTANSFTRPELLSKQLRLIVSEGEENENNDMK